MKLNERNNLNELVVLGVIQGTHGIKGLLKIKWFTERSEGLSAYGPVTLSGDIVYNINVKFINKNNAICSLEGINTKEEGEFLKGKEISVARSILPDLGEDEFYEGDLIGCGVEDPTGNKIGIISAVYNFGAGTLIEIDKELVRFDKENFPIVDIKSKKLVKNL